MTALKVKDFPGLTRIAPATIEAHTIGAGSYALRNTLLTSSCMT